MQRPTKELQGEGPDSFLTVTFSLWQLVIDALLADRVKVKWEVEAAKEVLQEIQEEETRCSRCSIEDREGKKGTCDCGNGKNVGRGSLEKICSAQFRKQSIARQESADSDFLEDIEESLEDEEEIIHREIRDLHRKLRRRSPPTPLAPLAYNDEGWWSHSNKDENRRVCFHSAHRMAPVMEVPDPNNPGQVMRQHFPLQFKEIKQLK